MSFINLKFIFSFLLIVLTGSIPLLGQQSQVEFGKNRIQRKKFKWKYISTYNFDIYYYEGGKDLAQTAANFAESDFKNIVDQIGFTPYSKIKLILYNSISDKQQSNIGLDNQDLLVGGQTNFVKSKIEVSFNGNQDEFRKDIRLKISETLINIMLYGGSLKEIVQSSYLLSLPEWYVSGAAAYIAEGWSSEMDNYVRGIFIDRTKYKNPAVLNGKEATIIGQSIWNFINERYGKLNIGNILNLTRILRNEESSIESNLGIRYSVFIREWGTFYSNMSHNLKDSYETVNNENKLLKKKSKNAQFKQVCINPNGENVAFVKYKNEKYHLSIYNIISKKTKNIFHGGQKFTNQEEDKNRVLIAWQSSETLAFIEKNKNKTRLFFYNVNTGKLSKRIIKEFNQILSFSFSDDGKRIVLSADKKGQSDIYVYDIQNNSFKQLTNDLFDDLDPCFSKNNSSIIFSSNRLSDTLNRGIVDYRKISDSYNIFIYQNNSSVLKKITSYGANIKPKTFDNDNIIYLSNEKGIYNLYKYNIISESTTQTSNFIQDVEYYDVNILTGALIFTSIDQKKENIYYYKGFNFNNNFQPELTQRQKQIEEKYPKKLPVNTSNDSLNPKKISGDELSDEEIDINNYHFESDVKKQPKEELVSKNKPTLPIKDEVKFRGPSKYQNNFSIDQVNSTIMIDPLRGLGILLEGNMADMMGNHKINAGLFGLTDLKSSNIFGEYLYLQNRIDYKLRYDRSTIFAYNETETQRYTLNKGTLTVAYPFSNSSRVSLSPNVMTTRFTNLNYSNQTQFFSKDLTLTYVGIKAELVHDNTSIKGINMMEGTRFKISLENNFNTQFKSENFGKLIFDFRNYLPIHRELILATRLSYGQFFGNSKKNFLLGGMDNWVFNSTTRHGESDPLNLSGNTDNSDLLFLEYVTNMRGFKYSTQYGNNYGLFNAELRIPIVKYFYRGAITSSFLKNFQIVGFTDIGSSWSGKNPFTTDNSTNTNTVGTGSSPFTATVINYKSPFLIGYGAGVRTMLLGYYVKFDLAYGIQDNKVQGRRFYLTLGYDF